MNLPNHDNALVERTKVVDYLLASDHPEGAGKAAFFVRFGYDSGAWEVLAQALLVHGRTHPVAAAVENRHGTKFQIDGPLVCPNGRTPSVRSIWIVEAATNIPRLVTAYPIQ